MSGRPPAVVAHIWSKGRGKRAQLTITRARPNAPLELNLRVSSPDSLRLVENIAYVLQGTTAVHVTAYSSDVLDLALRLASQAGVRVTGTRIKQRDPDTPGTIARPPSSARGSLYRYRSTAR